MTTPQGSVLGGLLVIGLLAVSARPGAAQGDASQRRAVPQARAAAEAGARTAVVTGVVFDSLTGAPLPGAEVWLTPVGATIVSAATRNGSQGGTEAAGRVATTGPDGTFRFDTLPGGRYAITFTHALLDSLGFTAPRGEVQAELGRHTAVTLTTSSAATVIARLCADTPPLRRAGTTGPPAAVFGTVRDGDTGRAVAGASAHVAWAETAEAPAGGSHPMAARAVDLRTDAQGVYRACGLPPGAVVTLTVTGPARPGAPAAVDEARVHLAASPLVVHNVTLADRRVADGGDRGPAPPAGPVVLTLLGPDGRPVPQARASVRGVEVAGDGGALRLPPVPVGRHPVTVRAIGYEPVTLLVPATAGAARRDTVRLARTAAVELDSVLVRARRSTYDAFGGFAARRAQGFGRFLDSTQIERRQAARLTQLFSGVPGLEVVPYQGGGAAVLSYRGGSARAVPGVAPGKCLMGLVVDGVPVIARPGPNDESVGLWDQVVDPRQILGLEVYPSAATVPPRYAPFGNACGVVLVWTRGGGFGQ